ncbi:MAG: peptide ABC transporter substrate-binding protein [Armatimonadetes bacterium]|nr:peptide ABC transporter substrate-binding protein [Armatimonadota bacterium]
MRAWIAVSVAALSLAVIGCGKGSISSRGSAEASNMLRYPIPTKPTSLDPAVVQDGDTIDLLQQVYEGLLKWGEDNRPAPNLAEKWEISEDGTEYTFHIKKGVKFSNGREMTAEDFKWSIDRACTGTFPREMADSYLGEIVGAKDVIQNKAKSVSGITTPDPYTVKIKIDKRRPYFLNKLTFPVSFVVAKESAPAVDEITKVEQMIGTGPFIAKSYDPNQVFTLVANKNYHGGAPKIEGIVRKIILDPQTRLNEFKSGQQDLVALERQDVEGLKKDAKFASQLHFYDRPAIWYVGLNVKEYPPFADVRVRRAFAMAINRDRIVNELLGGLVKKADCILPPGVLGHRDNTKMVEYNPAEAKKLLAEAGYPDGKGLPPLEIKFRDGRADIRTVAEAIQNDLKANLGISIGLKNKEWRAYLEENNAKKIPFFHMRWAADYLDPQNFLSLMLATTGEQNKTNWSNPEFDRLCAAADVEADEPKRLKMYADAEDIVLREIPWIPVYFQRDAELISPRVAGMRESLFGHLPHTTVTLTP